MDRPHLKTGTWIVALTVLGLLAVIGYLVTGGGDSAWGEPGDAIGPEDDGRRELGASTIGPSGPAPVPLEAPEVPPAPTDFDARRLGELLIDAGAAPLDVSAVEPTFEAELVAAEGEPGAAEAPEAERMETTVTRVGPTPPQRALARAVFWRDMLESRIDATRRQIEAARERGQDGQAARLEAQLARLERERPSIATRVSELEAALPPVEEALPEEEVLEGEAPVE